MVELAAASAGDQNERDQSEREINVSKDAKKGYGSMLALVVFGVLALYLGWRWLPLLIPAAALVWYGAAPILGSGRN
jgi:hypothetical protein